MNQIKKYFPLSFRPMRTAKDLLITILIYIVADVVCGLIIGLLGKLPLMGLIFSIIGWAVGIYFFAGLVIAILNFLGVFKN